MLEEPPIAHLFLFHGSLSSRNYPSYTFMGLTFALNDYDEDQCRTAYRKRAERTADFKERIQNIAALGRHRVGRVKMEEWTRQMQETLMHCKAANGGVVKECLMNEESWRELNRILEIMMSRLTAGSTITEQSERDGTPILQSQYTPQSLLNACQSASNWHTIEFEERVKEVRDKGMSLHRDNLSVLYNWSSEMKDTFLASAEATDYLKNDESWTRMRRLFDIMDLRMAYGAGITEIQNRVVVILPRFRPAAFLRLVESHASYRPLPSADNLPPSALSAPARSPPPISPILRRVSHGRVERPRQSDASTESPHDPFQVGRRGPLRGTFGNRNPQDRRRLRLWDRERVDGSQRAERTTIGSENESD